MTVTVGLGTGSQQAKIQGVRMVAELAMGAIQAGLGGRVFTEQNAYHLLHMGAKAAFPKDADMLFTNPSRLPPPQEKPDPEMIKLQLQKEKQDTAAQLKQMKFQFDGQMEQFRAAVQGALQERDQHAKASLEQFKAMVDRAAQESEQRANLLQESIKASSNESLVALQGTVDGLLEAQKHQQNKIEELVKAGAQIQVEKSKPKPQPSK